MRKFYDTQAKAAKMLDNMVEKTIGHSLGVAESYDRFTEEQILEEYLKAVPSLTINDDSRLVSKQLSDLQQSSKDNSQTVKAKFEEKDNQITSLNKKVDELKSEVDWYLDALRIAKKIVARSKNGMIDEERSILDERRRFTVQYVDDDNQPRTVKVPIDDVEILDGTAKENLEIMQAD
jgi:peptidoglycan hydrolase CwlO-like protein